MRISVKYNNGSEIPEVKRQDTPVFLTSQQLNLRKLMNSISPDESASGSYSFSINNKVKKVAKPSLSHASSQVVSVIALPNH
jgi:hypothetical protein